jgi:hypothetical protein
MMPSPWVTRAMRKDLPSKSFDAYRPASRDYCTMPLHHDAPCDSPIGHDPADPIARHVEGWTECPAECWNAEQHDAHGILPVPYDPAYYSDGSRV